MKSSKFSCTEDFKYEISATFIRIYKLENIIQGQEEYLYYLTLLEFDTVLVYNFFDSLQVGKNYEFEFSKFAISDNVSDTINSIFKYDKVISIYETDKIGLEQNKKQ